MTPSKTEPTFWEGDVPWVSPKDMKTFRVAGSIDMITSCALTRTGINLVARGAVLMVTRGMILDHTVPIALNEVPVTLNQDMKALVAVDGLRPEYLAWSLLGHQDELLARVEVAGHGTCALRTEQWGALPLPLPQLDEQTQIAKFLDYETARIDALIEKQQQLIALLKEKRQAVISHAVTKGLNPNAPMRDSGVEWLGEVPAHWEEYPLKAIFGLKHGYAFDGSKFSSVGEYILLTPGNFRERGGFRYKNPEKFYVGEEIPTDFILEAGQLLVAMTEQAPGLLGAPLFVPPGETFLHNQRLGLVRNIREDKANIAFLFHLFNSDRYRAEVSVSSTGAKVKHTSSPKLLSIKVWLPSTLEQDEITQFVDESITRLDDLVTKSKETIDLLRERRTALISAAVTGKIDVRNWQAPDAQAQAEVA
jgi:type I restriction enzyme S subunit